MRAIDTNVLVRLLVRDDSAQANAAEAFIAKGAFVSYLVLVETVWVLDAVYGRSPGQIAAAISMLLQHNELVLQEPEAVAAALEDFRKRPAAGFSDCMILQLARKAGHVPLGTFDRDLAKLKDMVRV